MVNKSAQSFGTGFLVIAALTVLLLNIALVSDLHEYSRPPCTTGEDLASAGVLIDVSRGVAPGICVDN